MVNWSYILKYLMANISKLKVQLQEERSTNAATSSRPREKFHSQSSNHTLSTPNPVVQNQRSLDRKIIPSAVNGKYQTMDTPIYARGSGDEDSQEDGEEREEGDSPDLPRSKTSHIKSSRSDDHYEEEEVPHSSRRHPMEDPPPLPPPSPSPITLSPPQKEQIERVQYRMRSAISTEKDARRRRNEAGKLGPRLTAANQAVHHNTRLLSAEMNQMPPPPDADEVWSVNDSDAGGSFRSAATVGSIPPQRVRIPLATGGDAPSSFAKQVVSGLGVEEHQAVAAMSVIDRVSSMTEDQIRRLDPETQEQVRDLKKLQFYNFPSYLLFFSLYPPLHTARRYSKLDKNWE